MEWRSQLPLEDDVRHGSLLNLALVRIAGSRLEEERAAQTQRRATRLSGFIALYQGLGLRDGW